MDAIRARLDALPAELAPLADAARGLLDRPCEIDADGTIWLGHRPWVAPENYAMALYPGLRPADLARYARPFGLTVPAAYARFLTAVNGAFCFGMSLAGVPASAPLVDRSRLRCHDLGTAATFWADEYRKRPAGAVHVGGRSYSYRENVGYFVAGERVVCVRKSGTVVGEWAGVGEMLAAELPVSAALDAELHPEKPASS